MSGNTSSSLKLDKLGVISFGKLVELGEVNFGIQKLGEISIWKLEDIGEVEHLSNFDEF